jgi:cytochrome c553
MMRTIKGKDLKPSRRGLVLLLAALGCCASFASAAADRPEWAYPQASAVQPAASDDGRAHSVPGSTLHFTAAQINDLSNTVDWFPHRHAPPPTAVVHGSGAALACAACHLTSGMGHPESSHLAGLPAAYLQRQLADFRSGARQDPVRMSAIARALSVEDAQAASLWFAALTPRRWIKVIETASVPVSYGTPGRMRLPLPGGGREALGQRIVELPQNPQRALRRDPNSGFIAYVPVGSVAKGRALASTGGGKTAACTSCHGARLTGMNGVPGIAGASALYIARQLFAFQTGTRDGASAALMKPIAAPLTDEDFIDLSAYLASLPP